MLDVDLIVALAAAYAIGSIPFAVIAGRLAGADVRLQGSRNPGATNVLRTLGPGAGAAVAALDIAKGAVSVLVAQRITSSEPVAAAAGAAAVVGHVFPLWLRFRGGRGVATGFGAFAVLAPAAAMLALTVFLVAVWITRHVSLGSIAASAALPSLVYVTKSGAAVLLASFAVGALIVLRHRGNMARLLAGTEPRI